MLTNWGPKTRFCIVFGVWLRRCARGGPKFCWCPWVVPRVISRAPGFLNRVPQVQKRMPAGIPNAYKSIEWARELVLKVVWSMLQQSCAILYNNLRAQFNVCNVLFCVVLDRIHIPPMLPRCYQMYKSLTHIVVIHVTCDERLTHASL